MLTQIYLDSPSSCRVNRTGIYHNGNLKLSNGPKSMGKYIYSQALVQELTNTGAFTGKSTAPPPPPPRIHKRS